MILAASFVLCTSAYAEDVLSAEDAMSIILDHHNVQTDIDISNYLTLNAKTMTREVAVTAVIRSFGVYPADEPDYVWDDEAEQDAQQFFLHASLPPSSKEFVVCRVCVPGYAATGQKVLC